MSSNNTSMMASMFEELKKLILGISHKLDELTKVLQEVQGVEKSVESKVLPPMVLDTKPIEALIRNIRIPAPNLSAIEDKLDERKGVDTAILEKLASIEQFKREPVISRHLHNHCHAVAFASSKVMFVLVALALTVICMGCYICKQIYVRTEEQKVIQAELSKYASNDLKYRFIQMNGGISAKNLQKLEDDCKLKSKVEDIQKRVVSFEGLCLKQAQIAAHKRLTQETTKLLENEDSILEAQKQKL